MIPLALVTGFLGSGKTTLLKRLAERDTRRLVFLVNEFAEADVDGEMLRLAGGRAVAVVGGSIFCTCKVTDFIDTLGTLYEQIGGAGGDGGAGLEADGVVVEASGIADPRVVRRMLHETQLDEGYELRSVVTVVDPGTLPKLLQTLPNVRGQIEAADVVLINKTDAYGEAAIEAAEGACRSINPAARLLRAVRCEAAFDVLAPAAGEGADGQYARCRDPNYHATRAAAARPVDLVVLRHEAERLGDDLYRLKGHVATADGRRYIDYSASGWTDEPAGAETPTGLAIIGAGAAADRLDALARRLDADEPGSDSR